jgi:hypothetical protein
VEEVTAVSAGRSARRQIYRLPGGAERVVNTRFVIDGFNRRFALMNFSV